MTAPARECQPEAATPYQHVCPDGGCIYLGQPSFRGCGCHRTREQMMQARIEELTKALEPFARAANAIPDKLPDDLWTHCSSYDYQMSEAEFEDLKERGLPLLDRKISLTLWIDGHPLSDFRNARRALALPLDKSGGAT